jgi:hypothetical protein
MSLFKFNPMKFDTVNAVLEELSSSVHRATEVKILEQLGDLVSKGLLEVEYGPYTLTQDSIHQVSVHQMISLKLKDKEYIESLEAEVKALKLLLKEKL